MSVNVSYITIPRMNKLEAITTLLAVTELQVLKKYYSRSRGNGSQHFRWETENDELINDYAALKALHALGYIHLATEDNSLNVTYKRSYYLTLYPSAFQRIEFEEYSPVKKKYTIFREKYKDNMLIISFVISVILAILKLFEFIASR